MDMPCKTSFKSHLGPRQGRLFGPSLFYGALKHSEEAESEAEVAVFRPAYPKFSTGAKLLWKPLIISQAIGRQTSPRLLRLAKVPFEDGGLFLGLTTVCSHL